MIPCQKQITYSFRAFLLSEKSLGLSGENLFLMQKIREN